MAQRPATRLSAPPLPESLSASQLQRRDRIIDACLGLLRGQDHAQIQMKDVAAEAEVALGTVYRYFQSKDHLFAEALASWARRLRTNVERRPLRGDTNSERLTDVLNRSLRAFQTWPQLARVVMELESSTDPFTREIFFRNNQDNVTVYEEALSGLPPERAREVVRVAGAVFDIALRQWVVGACSIADAYDHIRTGVWIILEFCEDHPEGAIYADNR